MIPNLAKCQPRLPRLPRYGDDDVNEESGVCSDIGAAVDMKMDVIFICNIL
jgi:hypothetical protein